MDKILATQKTKKLIWSVRIMSTHQINLKELSFLRAYIDYVEIHCRSFLKIKIFCN